MKTKHRNERYKKGKEEINRFERRRGSHVFLDNRRRGGEVVSLTRGRALPSGRSLVRYQGFGKHLLPPFSEEKVELASLWAFRKHIIDFQPAVLHSLANM
jgi:hypothetical protein